MNWQSIDTAPKDGTRILAVVAGWHICVASWARNCWQYLDPEDLFSEEMWEQYQQDRIDAGAIWEPTHWMPLPPQPILNNKTTM